MLRKFVCASVITAALCGAHVQESKAVEFKIFGSFKTMIDVMGGGNFMGQDRKGGSVYGSQWSALHQTRDNFEVFNTFHIGVDAIASEQLMGRVLFEIGGLRYGRGVDSAALGADGKAMEVRHAYIDWMVPNSELKLRMGLQAFNLPGFALDSPILAADLAGIVGTYKFNNNVSLTAAWLRPLNDNFAGNDQFAANVYDNFDLGSLLLPIRFDSVKVTPWILGGAMGQNTLQPTISNSINDTKAIRNYNFNTGQGIEHLQLRDGLMPAAFSTASPSAMHDQYTTMGWGGLTTEIFATESLAFKFDGAYGFVDSGKEYLNRDGWFAMLLAEYKADWGLPGLYAWYFSGDDGDIQNGSERMPYISSTNNWRHNSLSSFGYRGSPTAAGGKGVLGTNPSGTWGIGARIKNLSFFDKIKHTIRVNYMGGTNSPEMADYITGRKGSSNGHTVYRNNTDFNSFGVYFTTADSAIEVNLDNSWKIYDNLEMTFELGYIHLWMDNNVWGKVGNDTTDSLVLADAFKCSIQFHYTF